MGWRSLVFLSVLMGVSALINPESVSAHQSNAPQTVEENSQQKEVSALERSKAGLMATAELDPNNFQSRRAAKVVQHYLNTRYGSPYKVFGQERVHKAAVERRGHCSAEVISQRGEKRLRAQVQTLDEALLKIDTKSEEEALYEQYRGNKILVTTARLPDSFGHIEPDMKPFWHLCIVASSFIMLNESTEDTLYNVAQVAKITQLASEDEQLKFDSHILLHDLVSQEIPEWKLQFTWSPAKGVKVLMMEQLPRCPVC